MMLGRVVNKLVSQTRPALVCKTYWRNAARMAGVESSRTRSMYDVLKSM